MAELKPGDLAPNFTLKDQFGNWVSLDDLKGALSLVYFYPKVDASGGMAQACCLRGAIPDFRKSGVKICGISPDDVPSQKEVAEKCDLTFSLLADTDYAVAEAYGVWAEKALFEKTDFDIIPSSFLIDENGVILDAWSGTSPAMRAPIKSPPPGGDAKTRNELPVRLRRN